MSRALVLGGTGFVGRAIAERLTASGWDVDVTGRDERNHHGVGTFVRSDRRDADDLRAAYGVGADLVVDCICFTAADARLLLPLADDATSTVLISTKAVYVDDAGNHSNSDVSPAFDGPVRETQATMAPSDVDYRSREGYGANKVAAEQVLLESGAPVSVLRPSKIHGVGARPPREWHFVRRVLDRRPVVLLAHRGEGGDHTTAAANLAALVETVAARPGARILNSADPDAPNGLEIARTVARHLGHTWAEVLVDDDGAGRHPWDKTPPFVLDTGAAEALGYRPAGDYAATVAAELDWLVAERPVADDDDFFAGSFDYASEDAFLRDR